MNRVFCVFSRAKMRYYVIQREPFCYEVIIEGVPPYLSRPLEKFGFRHVEQSTSGRPTAMMRQGAERTLERAAKKGLIDASTLEIGPSFWRGFANLAAPGNLIKSDR